MCGPAQENGSVCNDRVALGVAIERRLASYAGLAPLLQESPALLLAIDWAGQQVWHRFSTLSVLVTSQAGYAAWEPRRDAVRKEFLADGRRMCFKELGHDKVRRRALGPFLEAADQLSGLLFTLLVDVRSDAGLVHRNCLASTQQTWAPGDNERMWMTALVIDLLLRGLSGAGQDVQVLLDEDSIFDTTARREGLCSTIGRLPAPHPLSLHVADPSIPGPPRVVTEDLLAIPDLAAGALAELSTSDARIASDADGLMTAERDVLQEKALSILDWLCLHQRHLRRMAYLLRQDEARADAVDVMHLDLLDAAAMVNLLKASSA